MKARIVKRRRLWRVYCGRGLMYAGRSFARACAFYSQARAQ